MPRHISHLRWATFILTLLYIFSKLSSVYTISKLLIRRICLGICQCLQGSDKCDKRKFNCEEHKRCHRVWWNAFLKKDVKFLLIEITKPVLKLLAHHDTSNHHNCNKIYAMLSLFTEFTTEFEST